MCARGFTPQGFTAQGEVKVAQLVFTTARDPPKLHLFSTYFFEHLFFLSTCKN